MALSHDTYQKKRQIFIDRTALVLAIPPHEAIELLSIGRQQSIRINTLNAPAQQTIDEIHRTTEDVKGEVFSWYAHGLYFEQAALQALKESSLSDDGVIYIQNAASWLPVLALTPQSNETILDMCAAPGGKTSHIAQEAQNGAYITANDNSLPRLHKLQRNLERLGVENVEYTLHDAARLTRHFEAESFDKILLDAPCSGEGMMRLDNKKDFESWSVAHIKRLQQLQKKLIVQAWTLLKPGGTLVYSTCTMAPEENEAVVQYLLRRYPDAHIEPLDTFREALPNQVPVVDAWNGKTFDDSLKKTLRLKPSRQVEAFYVAKITKKATIL